MSCCLSAAGAERCGKIVLLNDGRIKGEVALGGGGTLILAGLQGSLV